MTINSKKLLVFSLLLFFMLQMNAQPGVVLSYVKVSSVSGNFVGPLDNGDFFGNDVAK